MRKSSLVSLKVLSITPRMNVPPPWIEEMWVQMGQNWADMFNILELSLMRDTDDIFSALYMADVVADTPMAASYLDMSISATLDIQQLQGCISANTLVLMENY